MNSTPKHLARSGVSWLRRESTSIRRRANRAGWSVANPLARKVASFSRVVGGPDPEFAVLCIYRSKNEESVLKIATEANCMDSVVLLWSLDSQVPASLERWTVGAGPGDRCELLNRLYRELALSFEGHIVVCDDDVRLEHVGIDKFVRASVNSQLDLAQPAHAGCSTNSHAVTLSRSPSIARLTRFVEIGPMFVAAPSIVPHIFPMDETYGMGHGLDFIWSLLVDEGFRLGVLDAIIMVHSGSVGDSYDTETSPWIHLIDEAGGYSHVNATLSYWRPWHRKPPWYSTGPTNDQT